VPGAAQQLSGQVQPAAQFGLNQMTQFANPNSALAKRQTADPADTVERIRAIDPAADQVRAGLA
jgi:hypothetical protein